MYIKRALEDRIREINTQFPALMVTGPRQVGKITMLKNIAEAGRKYISLDDPVAREMAKSDPALFLERYSPPVLIDEIQYAPQLLPYIKLHIDAQKNAGDFWMTGSQMFHLMKNVTESLAGRVAVIPMYGLSQSEIAGCENVPFIGGHEAMIQRLNSRKPQKLDEVYTKIHRGSMPAVCTDEAEWEIFYSSYLNTYLQRDIKDLAQVGDEMAFMRFMTACAARTSQMVNYADIAKDVDISPPTAKHWLSILVSSGVIALIQPYFNNALKRAIKAPNMYFMDTGLCAYLTRWDSAKTLEVSAVSGAFFETYVVSEIMKSYYHAGKRPPVYYYRDTDGKEIDLLLEQNGTLYPIEIKKSANPNKDTVKHFSVIEKTNLLRGEGSVVCLYQDVMPINKNDWIIPVWLI